ncbi:MAG: oligosaccharide flippase family protein [Rikenellaceae bacterium]|nr:oligosaccharide flippase family protein [Rikenellaceae bacterium]
MLEKLAKQTAVYGISTILVRFLSYLLTPFYTRVFGPETYGIVTEVYALIPLALTLLTMGMESSYFRFTARVESETDDREERRRGKERVFRTTWGSTSLAALTFFGLVLILAQPISDWMGAAYTSHPEYIAWVAAIVLLDVMTAIPAAKLREENRALHFVAIKLLSVGLNVALAFAFGLAGLFESDFGVGWVFVANFVGSLAALLALLPATGWLWPSIDRKLLGRILCYSLPLLLGGLAGTANEFIDRQLIKWLVPEGAMAELGIYGAITKIAVVMMLFYQMYRLAAEPFFLSNFKKEEFKEMNAAAMKYYLMASMLIFLAIALFRDLFALIVGRDFREGIYILPVVLASNVLAGVWLNLSFWYKREERTSLAIVVTGAGLLVTLPAGFALIPSLGYYGAAWMRLISELTMVGVSLYLTRRFYPTPYRWGRILEYVATALVLYAAAEWLRGLLAEQWVTIYSLNALLFAAYGAYLVKRENIDLKGMAKSLLKRK